MRGLDWDFIIILNFLEKPNHSLITLRSFFSILLSLINLRLWHSILIYLEGLHLIHKQLPTDESLKFN